MIQVFLLVASLSLQDAESFAATLRAGEPVNGFPNWAERVIHAWINRARVDPQKELAACGSACVEKACYRPQPPLAWSESLNRAARFHAAEMQKQGYFSHASRCTVVPNINSLYPVACDGSSSCACVGGSASCGAAGCTGWVERVSLFGAFPEGEIIASPSDPNQAFYLWLFEPGSSDLCAFNNRNGHRWLILQASGAVGAGVTMNSVADFGGGPQPYKIPSAAHYPRQAESVEVWANWFDAQAPRSAHVVIGGRCVPMSLQRGSGTNGAWSATVTGAGSGCHRYYISFIDAAGVEVTYPATGTLGIGGSSCEDWSSTRVSARCSTAAPPPPQPPAAPARRRSVKR